MKCMRNNECVEEPFQKIYYGLKKQTMTTFETWIKAFQFRDTSLQGAV